MQDLPKIVRERLQAATPGVSQLPPNHPDADALTAFAEQSLPERERAVVLDHLARCGDCRDIVALALPATESVVSVTRVPATGWLAWPALRWGLVAAGVVAIASVGIVQYQRRSGKMAAKPSVRVELAFSEAANRSADQAANEASKTNGTSVATPRPYGMTKKAENRAAPPPSGLADSVSADDSFIFRKSTSRAMAPRVPTAQPQGESGFGGAVGGALPHGPRLANSWQSQQNTLQNQDQASVPAVSSPFAKQQAAGDLTANISVPAPSEPVQVETQSAQVETKGRNSDALKDLPPAPPRQNEEYASARIGKAKPVVSVPAGGGVGAGAAAAQSSAGPIGGPVLASSAPVPRWTISSTGSLQRSFDQGMTWQVVDVNAKPAYFLDSTSVQISEKTSRAKTKEADKALKRDDSSPIFRAVAANGSDVWAGGSGGALYHSADAGKRWTRVTPASSDATLTGDIVGLEFPDTQQGKVSTSAGEIWTTSDGGRTWQKQQSR